MRRWTAFVVCSEEGMCRFVAGGNLQLKELVIMVRYRLISSPSCLKWKHCVNFIPSDKWPKGGEPSVTLTASLTGEWSTDSTKCVNQSNSNTNNKIARVSFAHSKVLQEVIHTIPFTYSHHINPTYCYRKHCVLRRCAIMMFFKLEKTCFLYCFCYPSIRSVPLVF